MLTKEQIESAIEELNNIKSGLRWVDRMLTEEESREKLKEEMERGNKKIVAIETALQALKIVDGLPKTEQPKNCRVKCPNCNTEFVTGFDNLLGL